MGDELLFQEDAPVTGIRDGKLLYGGEVMDTTPVKSSMKGLARRLLNGRAIYVHLEPGDMTRYEFFALPMWNEDLKPAGRGLNTPHRWLWVSPINLPPRGKVFSDAVGFSDEPISPYYDLIEIYGHDWTCMVVAHFITRLKGTYNYVRQSD